MARILTGIQSSGKPHLGNILGAMKPAIDLSNDSKNESFFFIADLHSLTTIKDPKTRIENTNAVPAVSIPKRILSIDNLGYRRFVN
jgi:tryptophanyl-tRNA synthetase